MPNNQEDLTPRYNDGKIDFSKYQLLHLTFGSPLHETVRNIDCLSIIKLVLVDYYIYY